MNVSRELIIGAFWAKVAGAMTTGATQSFTIPASPGPYTVTAPNWVADLSVCYALGGDVDAPSQDYQPLTLVGGAPADGQYAVVAGVYTFNAGDAGNTVRISFKPTPTPAFVTKNRRLKHFDDVAAVQQPALYMVQNMNTVKQTKGIPPTWRLHPKLYLYDNCGSDPTADTGNRINWLVDAIDNALKPNVLGYQTLDGLAAYAWISGAVEVYEGFQGMLDQSVAIIPCEILVPDSSGPV